MRNSIQNTQTKQLMYLNPVKNIKGQAITEKEKDNFQSP
jgi:hypothetical protein